VEGRVRDHVVRPTREAQVARIALHDDDVAVERFEQLSETIGTSGMPLDRDDACPRGDERPGQGSGTGADVDDDRMGWDPRVSDEARCELGLESVPSPLPWRGHGDGPSRRTSCVPLQRAPSLECNRFSGIRYARERL
jgi:hypothetical protein